MAENNTESDTKESVSIDELKEQLYKYNQSYAGKPSTTESHKKAEALFDRMVNLGADQFLALPPEKRLKYVSSLRHSLTLEYPFTDDQSDRFFDSLLVRVAEKLENSNSS